MMKPGTYYLCVHHETLIWAHSYATEEEARVRALEMMAEDSGKGTQRSVQILYVVENLPSKLEQQYYAAQP